MPYSLKDVNTQRIRDVESGVSRILEPFVTVSFKEDIHPLFDTVQSMFAGSYKNFGQVSTRYHDLEHTLQATVCFVRILEGRFLSGDIPVPNEQDCLLGITAIMLHDIGYLQDRDDQGGTGARYTLEHEQRGARMAQEYLGERGWSREAIERVTTFIRCTGPRSILGEVEFASPVERFLAQSVCTADYLGQMADYKYPEKLPILYREFEESDDYQNIPREERMFQSVDDLLEKTPGFWEFVKSQVLESKCGRVYRYLSRPPGQETNPYFQKIDRNMAKIRDRAEQPR